MGVVVAAGFYAWRQGMNISYVCTWGILCAINFVFDVISQVVPALLGLLSFSILSVAVRIAIPVVYFLGTVYAWHLYHDYEESLGLQPFTAYDPMGKFFDRYDPSAHIPLMKAGGLPGTGGLFPNRRQEPLPQERPTSPPAAPAAAPLWSLFSAPEAQEHVDHLQRGAAHYHDAQRRGAEAYGALHAARPGLEQTAKQGQGQVKEAGQGFFGAFAGKA